MNTAQKDTVNYLKSGLLSILAIIAFATLFGLAVTEWNTPAAEPAAKPVPECTACGCITVTESINVAGTAL